jgi:sigma-B regulation protein RsbU (phosphoserine phosphatase)
MEAQSTVTSENGTGGNETIGKMKILVVDDEPALEPLVRQRFRKKIRSNEWVFEFAHDGREALKQLEAHSDIGLVLTDINMPGMDGLTLLNHLGEMDRLLKAVVVSAYGDMQNIRTAMNRGAFDFVTKPVDFEDLETTIYKGLRELKAFRDAEEAQSRLLLIQNELSVAQRIQEAALPDVIPDRPEFDIFASMIPAREVGGDLYDYFLIGEDKLGFVIGDVSGKGLSASMLMSVTRSLLKALATKGASPGECVSDLNRLLYPDTLPEMFVTLFYGVLDTRTGTVTYCNAGHNPPFIVPNSGPPKLMERTGGMAVCLLADFAYQVKQITMEPGDTLFLYTDGVTEAMNAAGEEYLEERLKNVLEEDSSLRASDMVDRVIRSVVEHASGAPQSDDITALGLRYLGA